ncbi:hypothetical protein [Rhizobium leguminosarum]|uniref:hypothetical protein n=1 Tax=Rhizobium leguminosarum TaxID=384 RepID=UPI001C94FFE6|nr:hypothetical protein [Rhizobium leguminosarum]MBY5438861.1 hypothetical protein [Rhizobium leguminosarum]
MSGLGAAQLAADLAGSAMDWNGQDWENFKNRGDLPAPFDWLNTPPDFPGLPKSLHPQSATIAEGQPFVHFVSQFGHTADILLPFDPSGLTQGVNLFYTGLGENFSPLGQLVAGSPYWCPASWAHNWTGPAGSYDDNTWNDHKVHPNGLGWVQADEGPVQNPPGAHDISIAAFTAGTWPGTPLVAMRGAVIAAGSPAVSSGGDRLKALKAQRRFDGLPRAVTRLPPWYAVPVYNLLKQGFGLQVRDVPETDGFLGAEPGGKTIVPPRGPVLTIPGEPLPHPPGPGTKEKKARVSGGLIAIAQKAFHAITEYGDAVDALFDAIPKEKRCKTKSLVGKSWCVYLHLDDVDIGDAIVNLLWNQFEDEVIGTELFARNQKAAEARGSHGFTTLNSINGYGGLDALGELYGDFSKEYVNPVKDDLKEFLTRKFGI